MLTTLSELRSLLKAKRHQRGSIDFDLPEVKVKLDEKGAPGRTHQARRITGGVYHRGTYVGGE